MNLSFAGCGFLGIYHVGVAVCFKKYTPHLLLDKIGGASAGALAACCLLCDLPLGQMTSDFFRVVNEARSHSLGPFSPSFNIQTCLLDGLQKHLPADAHIRVSGRLHISVTRVYDGKNVILSEFNSRDELLQALLCACFIPGFSGILPPRFQGVRYMDGAFSDNLPILDENTITVSPFCGESDICPRDESSQLFHLNWANTSIEISRQNVHRFIRILFPPKADYLSKFCQQGFDDALQFLHRNNLINCRRCIAVQSTFVVTETITDPQDYDPECNECVKHRKDALRGDMPQTVVDVFQTYLDQANKGLANWLFKHRGIKLISLPATIPAELFVATMSKIVATVPVITKPLRFLVELILSQFNDVVRTKFLNKLSEMNIGLDLIETPDFDTVTGLQSNHHASRVSIMVEEHGNRLVKENDVDTFDHVLKVSTHQDAVYAYYYTDEANKVNVTEIFDMTEDDLPNNLEEMFEGHVVDTHGNYYHNQHNQHHQHYDIESQWNGVESDLFLDISMTNGNNSEEIEKSEEEEDRNSSHSDYSDPEVDHYCMEQQLQLQQQQQQQHLQQLESQPSQFYTQNQIQLIQGSLHQKPT